MPVIHIGKPSEAALDRLHRFFHELILEILSGKRKCKTQACILSQYIVSSQCKIQTRIFIHAYDPVFIAEKVAYTPINKTLDINEAITATVTGIEGVGGIETRGKFRLGLPKTPY